MGWQEYLKKDKKKRNPTNTILLVLFLLYLSPSIYMGIRDYITYSQKLKELYQRKSVLEKKVKELREIAYNTDDPYIIEKIAKEKLFMAKPNEEPILIIEKKEEEKNLWDKIIGLFKK